MSYAPGAPDLEAELTAVLLRAFFTSWVRRDEETDCWLWLRGLTPEGYATGVGGLQHRVSYEGRHGKGSAEGLDVHHTCEVKHCVNPDHLETLTRSEHMTEHWDLRLGR